MISLDKSSYSRRSLLRRIAALSAAGPLFRATQGELSAQARQSGPNRFSAPSDLKITDIRACLVAANFDYPIIRIDTNQGVYGLGECFAGATMAAALVLKAHLVGKNPLDIEGILGNYGRGRGIRGTAGHDFWNTGYGAVDLALHDIAGKVYGVPAWRLLGNKIRDRVLIYCDTVGSDDPKIYAQQMLARKKLGFQFFKMDLYTRMVANRPGAVVPAGEGRDRVGGPAGSGPFRQYGGYRCDPVCQGVRALQHGLGGGLAGLEGLARLQADPGGEHDQTPHRRIGLRSRGGLREPARQ
jgi:hypothetical protein